MESATLGEAYTRENLLEEIYSYRFPKKAGYKIPTLNTIMALRDVARRLPNDVIVPIVHALKGGELVLEFKVPRSHTKLIMGPDGKTLFVKVNGRPKSSDEMMEVSLPRDDLMDLLPLERMKVA